MGLAITYARARVGVGAPCVSVEVYTGGGLPGLTMVGLPEAAVREARDRVRAALGNCGLDWPDGRVIVHLGPAELPKEGGRFDLAIALGVLGASAQLPAERLADLEVLGELALDGSVRTVPGVLPAVLAAMATPRTALVPSANADEAALAITDGAGDRVLEVAHLLQVVAWCKRRGTLDPIAPRRCEPQPAEAGDLAEVRGHVAARRALEVAAAGAHNLLLVGPPGCGKSMLAQRLPGVLPPMARDEALEVAAVRSVTGMDISPEAFYRRPFRAPHHTASAVALVGGGNHPRPGEVSLAHRGVLFLDELPEFRRSVLEALREPLENGSIVISRAARQAEFPARFQLIAAMNPCPCGYLGDPSGRCRCSPDAVRRYRQRISGPLLDRIDLHVAVGRVNLQDPQIDAGDPSAEVAARVQVARERQLARQQGLNAWCATHALARHLRLDAEARQLLTRAVARFDLSGRAQDRVLKIARSVADLAGRERIATADLAEALSLRCLDRRADGADRQPVQA